MAVRIAKFAVTLAGLKAVQAFSTKGSSLHCIGQRAHSLEYDIAGEPNDGNSLSQVSSAQISVKPNPDQDSQCVPSVSQGLLGKVTNGSKELCYGANAAPTCDAAKSILPLQDDVECESCWVGTKASLFYTLNYSFANVHSIDVGLKDVHVKGALEARAMPQFKGNVAEGSKVLRDGHFIPLIDKIVGCPVCVRVKVSAAMPTVLNYTLTVKGSIDATVGADVDADLGDHYIHWDKKTGFKPTSTPKSLTVTPTLKAAAKAEADMLLKLGSSMQVDVDNVAWFHMDNVAPTSMTATLQGDKEPKLCATGNVGLAVGHEADVHVSLFGKKHEIHHWGPYNDWSTTKDVHKCIDVPTNSELVV